MKKNIIKKGLVLGTIILFIGISIIPSIGGANVKQRCLKDNMSSYVNLDSRDNILYVGGSGPDNYTRIQDAINDAISGDTVFVYDISSPYIENIMIEGKSITLMGEDKWTTFIEAEYKADAIFINADDVNLMGFTIQNSHTAIRLYESVGCTIYLNNIKWNSYGIIIDEPSNDNIIYNNNFMNNSENAYDEGNNIWNKPFPTGGNHWSDYEIMYPDAERFLFWFWDTPYEIPGGYNRTSNQDNLPLIIPKELCTPKSYNNNINYFNRWFERLLDIFPIF